MTQGQHHVIRRGDDIPSVSDYAHWNEDAERIWYEENRYDMEHADEIIEEEEDRDWGYEEPEEDIDEEFDTEEEAQYYFDKMKDDAHSLSMGQYGRGWRVSGYSAELYNKTRCTGDSRTCPVVHGDDPEGLCPEER